MHMTAKKKAPKKTGEALTREARAEIAQNLANIEAAEQRAAEAAANGEALPTEPDVVPVVAATKPKGRARKGKAAKDAAGTKNAPRANVGGRRTKTTKELKEKRLSALDAAAKVLASAKEPMNTKSLIAEMEKKGLWKSPGGKTPPAGVRVHRHRVRACAGQRPGANHQIDRAGWKRGAASRARSLGS
jgi:hypothetical protein